MQLGEADVRPDNGLRRFGVAVQAEIGKEEQQIGHADDAIAVEVTATWSIDRWPRNKWRNEKVEKGKKIEQHERKGVKNSSTNHDQCLRRKTRHSHV